MEIDKFNIAGMCIGGPYCLGIIDSAPGRVITATIFQTIGLDNNREAFYQLFDEWAFEVGSRDSSISPEVFDAFRTIDLLLDIVNEMIDSVKINKIKMYNLSKKGFMTATDLADWLVKKTDYTFREAHNITGKIVLMAEKKKKILSELSLEEFRLVEPKISKDIFNYVSLENSVLSKNSYGGTNINQVIKAIKRAKKKI